MEQKKMKNPLVSTSVMEKFLNKSSINAIPTTEKKVPASNKVINQY